MMMKARVSFVLITMSFALLTALATAQVAEVTTWNLPSPDALPGQLGIAGDGQVYLAEFNADKVASLDPLTNTFREWVIGNGPNGLAVIDQGVFYTLYMDNAIGTLQPAVSVVWSWPVPTAGSWPKNLVAAPSGPGVVNLWFNERAGRKVARYAPSTLTLPAYLGIDPVLMTVTPRTSDIEPVISTVLPDVYPGNPALPPPIYYAPGVTNAGFTEWSPIAAELPVEDVAVAPDGRVWFCQGMAPLTVLDPGTNTFLAYTLPAGTAAEGVTVAITGDVWFADTLRPAIGCLDSMTGDVTLWRISGGAQPFDLAVDDEGNVWFTDRLADTVGYLCPDESKFVVYHFPADAHPLYITLGETGQVWFTCERSGTVSRLTILPILEPLPVSPAGMLFSAYNITQSASRADAHVTYTYDGSLGLPIWIEAAATYGGVALLNIVSTPVRVDVIGTGTATFVLEYRGTGPIASDAIRFAVTLSPGRTPALYEEVPFATTWTH